MSGNVWEWTCSAYHNPYDGDKNICTNDAGRPRAVRGGSLYGYGMNARSANRDRNSPDYRYFNQGFRLAQD